MSKVLEEKVRDVSEDFDYEVPPPVVDYEPLSFLKPALLYISSLKSFTFTLKDVIVSMFQKQKDTPYKLHKEGIKRIEAYLDISNIIKYE